MPEKIRQAGWAIDEMPFITTHLKEDRVLRQQLAGYAGQGEMLALFTSRHAVEAVTALLPGPPDWSIACLSGATYAAVRLYWPLEAIVATAPHAAALAAEVIAAAPSGPVVFFCGDQRLDHLPAMLKQAGIPFEEPMVYETVATPQKVAAHYDAVLFFSPSAVHSFFSQNVLPERTVAFAIGETTAGCIQHYSKNKVIRASQPSAEAMIDKVIDYWDYDE
ncbi:uroporphyrinogen-III synthase [Taibaiella koreensis]|uniref:uroporphyrinogen-III synthase n=1 Tax=Taibaiella koreensis TaxID=1268548 RepID=UPI000E59A37F|nr:uroporphyrinogen-III synthase [Taibaiella koreensis]